MLDKLAAINFNIRELLWKIEAIREKIKKLDPKVKIEIQLKELLGSQINNCSATLLVLNDILNEIENGVGTLEAEQIIKSLKEN